MSISQDPNVWVVYGLILLLGLLLGVFLTAGGRKKWKTRYYDEVDRHKATERAHAETMKERDRELEAARKAPVVVAAPAAAAVAPRRKAGVVDRMLGRDSDGDGVPDQDDIAPGDSSRA